MNSSRSSSSSRRFDHFAILDRATGRLCRVDGEVVCTKNADAIWHLGMEHAVEWFDVVDYDPRTGDVR